MQAPFLSIILDSITEGVFTVDRDWKITSFNRAAERITGISRHEAISQKCSDVFFPGVCKTGCALKKTLATRKSLLDRKISIKNRHGKSIPVSISTAVLIDWEGKIVGGVETFRDLSGIECLKKEIARRYTFEDIIGKNHKIQDIFKVLPDIAQSDSTVLIQGPSGTGKELFARAIHDLSARRNGPFVIVNCGALPDTLLESELFGYVRGAFTDAKKNKPGRFSLADGGTIFLDEIGDISLSVQVKLLRVLQENTYEPLGSNKALRANARIITATNRDLLELIRKDSFREDMYYRISVVRIELPPLRERMDDIPILVDHFIEKFNAHMGKQIVGASGEVMEKFMNYDFPGNIRELENIVEHAFILCHGEILELKHLPRSLDACQEEEDKSTPHVSVPVKTLEETEADLIRQTLKKFYGHRVRTARELGIHKTTLWRKMRRYGLEAGSCDSFD
ncbi:MAG: sigma 54-interacting transcriptional regulator [Desulfobacterales bacterium]|nr:sigma 54-interacting transcriptional regulator [Desulfobacterales bacterium]